MGLFDAIASSAANLTDNVVGMVNQNHQNKVNLRMMREQNAFNAEQAQIQRDWQQQMWGMNNAYNSPNAMISRGLNPFVQGSAAMAGSRSPASGGAAATAAPVLSCLNQRISRLGSYTIVNFLTGSLSSSKNSTLDFSLDLLLSKSTLSLKIG
jgi:hypothetical protein